MVVIPTEGRNLLFAPRITPYNSRPPSLLPSRSLDEGWLCSLSFFHKNKPDSCDERPLRRILKEPNWNYARAIPIVSVPHSLPTAQPNALTRGEKKRIRFPKRERLPPSADGLNSLIRNILRASHLFTKLYGDAAISSRSIQDPTTLVWGRVFDPDGPHVSGRSLTDPRLRLNDPPSCLWS